MSGVVTLLFGKNPQQFIYDESVIRKRTVVINPAVHHHKILVANNLT